MAELFIAVMLGHFVGDYLLQSKKMALVKSEPGRTGLSICVFHCLVYTLCICLFAWRFQWWFIGLVFLSHFPIDRWSLASFWLKMIKGRDMLTAYQSKEKYHEIDLCFSCLVYAVCDNTLHLVLLWFICKII